MSKLDKERLDCAFNAYWATEGGTFKSIEAAILAYGVHTVTDWEDVEQRTNVGQWCDSCQTTHWSGQCDPDDDSQRGL